MTRAGAFRYVALWVGLIAALAGPGAAYAHGLAHHEWSEHVAHHAEAWQPLAPAVNADGHPADHGHAKLDPAAFGRVLKDVVALHGEAPRLPAARIVAVADTGIPDASEVLLDHAGLPPPRSRAPPAL